ncbi:MULTISPECIES: family 2A encapsulin nanocompartment cargo protein cysteine desulfurase [Methylosinus]|uniref:Cysteine desulfurase n=1 Tax=Methylosinus trichosporium (strain ATCC 35070 / NCIMB 11131 / UNIQEM 75 / OB3b) TaxID=595536 RepID=A0A2D2D6R8_METT3|nr:MULTISPECIES: family 2A encapsulin nanocompartment cargo protein cysteine desulfurase [Methylosinus]ATQ70655.1 SufS family cysteine desulfurase [Methylosinus trichosporium OB3b]OBS50726.1 segregation protein B [Methylosinus sp. 3S-1]
MSSAPSNSAAFGAAAPDAPSEEALMRHGAPAFPDPALIARLANAFFLAPPNEAPAPLSPGAPIVPPALPEAPAPSVVTSVAPLAPARSPMGPPDVPPTTIPSIAPTPNLSTPSAPAGLPPAVLPPALSDVPQPGASAGAYESGTPAAAAIDYSAIPSSLAQFGGVSPLQGPAPYGGYDADSVPGGVKAAPTDNLYFLRKQDVAPGAIPSASSLSLVDRYDADAAAPDAPTADIARESSAYAGPSRADPHRLSDAVALGTPNVALPRISSQERSFAPGAAGPAAADSFYFLDRAGVVPAAPAAAPAEPQGFAPQIVAAAPASPSAFDPYAVKRDFPILQQQVHGKPLVWLDNAATTQKPRAVIDRLAHFYEYENSNIHRAAHALAARSTDAYEAAREKVRRFLKAPSVKDIIFVRGATEAINLVAQSWGRRNVQAGDEIVISWLEHHANIVPWQQLCADKGARLRVAPVDDRGQILLEDYEKLLNPKTRIVSVTQVSNALGTVTPVHEITAMAHRHGARVLIDGAQSVSHMPVDVQSIDCDFFVFSGHKVFGPTGIGVLYGKDEVLADMPPWQGGGNMIADVTFEKTIYQSPPERFEAGTGNIADAVGLGAALDYVESIGMEVIARYEHDLLVYATEKMRLVPGLTFIGTATEKASVLSFVLDGHRTEDVGKALDREGIAVRAGHHCAQPILRRFGLEATVRPSLAFYNSCADVDALVAALLRLQSGRGGPIRDL